MVVSFGYKKIKPKNLGFALSFYIYSLNYYIIRITDKYMGKTQGIAQKH